MAARGRDSSSLDQAPSYDAAAIKQRNEQRAALLRQRAVEAQTMGVIERWV